MDGYFFFEKVDDEAGRVSFRANFVDAETGKTIARTSIPFETHPRSDVD